VPGIKIPEFSRFFDDNVKLILFNSIALGGAGLSLLALGFVPDAYPISGVILLTMISMFTAAASSGFFKGAVLYTRSDLQKYTRCTDNQILDSTVNLLSATCS
jgi:hypothetical protein